jgi:hypothetical protein
MKQIRKIEISETGLPAMLELGRGFSNMGSATIICNFDGSAKKPLYIRTEESSVFNRRAVFSISDGDIVIEAQHRQYNFTTAIFKIIAIDKEHKEAVLEMLTKYKDEEWYDQKMHLQFIFKRKKTPS